MPQNIVSIFPMISTKLYNSFQETAQENIRRLWDQHNKVSLLLIKSVLYGDVSNKKTVESVNTAGGRDRGGDHLF